MKNKTEMDIKCLNQFTSRTSEESEFFNWVLICCNVRPQQLKKKNRKKVAGEDIGPQY